MFFPCNNVHLTKAKSCRFITSPILHLLSMKLPFRCVLLAAAATFAACAHDPRLNEETVYMGGFRAAPKVARANYDNVSYWDGDHTTGAPRIHIRLSEQRAYFYKGQELVGISVLSTGREGLDTPTGNFKIIQKDKDHTSSIFGDYVDATTGAVVQKDVDTTKDPKPKGTKYDGAKMPYFMRVKGGVGMHEGFLPGYPASHGCIRMPEFMAMAFFRNVELGTPVEITQ